MRSLIVLTVAAAAAFAVAPFRSPRGPDQTAAPREDAAVPFKVGERLTYDVTWSTFLVAGTASSTVTERRSGDRQLRAYHLIADGRPIPLLQRLYNIYYKMESMLDTATLLPQRMSLYSEDSGGRRLAATRFDRARAQGVLRARRRGHAAQERIRRSTAGTGRPVSDLRASRDEFQGRAIASLADYRRRQHVRGPGRSGRARAGPRATRRDGVVAGKRHHPRRGRPARRQRRSGVVFD